MQYGKQPRARIVWRASETLNGDLLDIVATVANRYAGQLRWPEQLPPEHAARILWQWVRDHTRYYPDRAAQHIRTPRAFMLEQVGDCKSTAAFIASMAAAAGRDAWLKFVKLPGRSHYGHVYAVVDGVPVDPLLDFGKEPIYSAAHYEPVTVEALVLNGLERGDSYGVTFSAGTGASNIADLYARALNILDAQAVNGATVDARDARVASVVADFVEQRYPGWDWETLSGVPCMGSLWEDLHKATTNVTRENPWLKDASRINPLLIPVRFALLELTKSNIGGLADMFSKANQHVLKAQWEANGGKWNELTQAMSQGRGKKGDDLPPPSVPMNGTPADLDWWVEVANRRAMNGPDDVYYMPGGNPNPTTTPPPSQSTPPISSGGGGASWNSIWDIAGPLVNSLLGSAAGAAGQALTNAIAPKPPQPPQIAPPPVTNRPPSRPRVTPAQDAAIAAQLAARRAAVEKKRKQEKTNKALLIVGGGAALLALSGAFKPSRRNG